MLGPTEVLLDTACTRSMGGQKAAEAYSKAVLEKAGIPTQTLAGRSRPYHVGGGRTVYTQAKQALPTRLGESPETPVSIAFETGDFGSQPLLFGSTDSKKLRLNIDYEDDNVSVYSKTLRRHLPVRLLPGNLIALDLFGVVDLSLIHI